MDATGNRRYWPVQGPKVDLPALRTMRDQLWAEAVHAYRKGERWHLNEVENGLAWTQQEEARHKSAIEDRLEELLSKQHTPQGFESGQLDDQGKIVWVRARQVHDVLGLNFNHDRALAQAFRALGWYRWRQYNHITKERFWAYEKRTP
jgi:predicted P-loop ATPase